VAGCSGCVSAISSIAWSSSTGAVTLAFRTNTSRLDDALATVRWMLLFDPSIPPCSPLLERVADGVTALPVPSLVVSVTRDPHELGSDGGRSTEGSNRLYGAGTGWYGLLCLASVILR
jgi:hypothetical protein